MNIKCMLGFHTKESEVVSYIDNVGKKHNIIYIICKRCKKCEFSIEYIEPVKV